MEVQPSGYYQWLKTPLSQREKRDKELVIYIKQCWLACGGHYGYRNIHLDLVESNIDCGRDRILRLMQREGLQAIRGYKKPKSTTSGIEHINVANHLDRKFDVDAPNQWWVSDITYIHTHEGFLFLAVIMDLYARNIVGWSMGSRMPEDLVMDALTMAYWRRKPENTVMLHSDQGSQYTSHNWGKLLKDFSIEPSMSRRGNCHDNAVAESFFANLKKEKIRRKRFVSRDDAKQAIFNYIELFYNPSRRHTHNNRVSPAVVDREYFVNQGSV